MYRNPIATYLIAIRFFPKKSSIYNRKKNSKQPVNLDFLNSKDLRINFYFQLA